MKMFVIILFLLLLASPAYADVVSPGNNEVIVSDFYVTVTQTNAAPTSITAMLVGYSWQTLEKIGTDTFTKRFLISDYPAGDYILSSKYTNENMNVIYFPPVNIRIVKNTPTAAPTPAPLGNLTVVGLAAGNYTNQTKMWVSVMDSKNSSLISATIMALNPSVVASWTTQNGLTKVDLSGLAPDSYLIKVTAANYNDLSFFVNVTPPPLPKITVDGFKAAVEAGAVMTLLFTPTDVNVTLLESNDTYIRRVYPNSPEYKVNTANLPERSYKLRAEKDGYEVWTSVFFVADMSIHPTPTPVATAAPCFNIPETGRCVSADARDAFYVGLKMNPTPTATPSTTAAPQTISGVEQGGSDYMPYLVLLVIIGVGGYIYKKELDKKPAAVPVVHIADNFETRLADTMSPRADETIPGVKMPLKCPHCPFVCDIVLPLGTTITPELVQMYLAEHIRKEHTEKE